MTIKKNIFFPITSGLWIRMNTGEEIHYSAMEQSEVQAMIDGAEPG